jgi:hypothetical protein
MNSITGYLPIVGPNSQGPQGVSICFLSFNTASSFAFASTSTAILLERLDRPILDNIDHPYKIRKTSNIGTLF